MVVAEGVVGKDHGDLLAQGLGDIGGHRQHLRLHVGDAGLQRVAIEDAARHVVALGDDEIGHLQLGRARRGSDHHVAEQRPEDRVAFVQGGETVERLGAAARVGAVILGHDHQLAAVDTAHGVDPRGGGGRDAFVPAPIGRPDAGAMDLEAQPDRSAGLRMGEPRDARKRRRGAGQGRGAAEAGKRMAAGDRLGFGGLGHRRLLLEECTAKRARSNSARGGQKPEPEPRIQDHEGPQWYLAQRRLSLRWKKA